MNRGEGSALSLSCTGSEEGVFFRDLFVVVRRRRRRRKLCNPPFFPLPGLGPECLIFFPPRFFGEIFWEMGGRVCLSKLR